MKVKIKEFKSGKIKTMRQNYADILVKLKVAEYYEEPKNKELNEKPAVKESLATDIDVTPTKIKQVPIAEQNEFVENIDKLEEAPKPKKKSGRKKKYETKVITSEE